MASLIFGIEVVAILLWLFWGQTSVWSAIVGVVVIILVSQLAHHFLRAR
ncbi:hypothetical protein [Levilactobacillus bambusae]|nr:hypothetical protein [Levilactobacillus bambusae]